MTMAHDPKRRHLLKLLGALPQVPAGLASLAAMHEVAAQGASDSKFLVCLFMRGGNDQSNMVVPTSTAEYGLYRDARPSISLAAPSLVGIQPANFSGPTLGLHPSLSFVAQLFNQGRAALVANVGNLVVPVSQTQWNKGSPIVPVPNQLFSHVDQEMQWQSASPRKQIAQGWLGRVGDVLGSTYNAGNPLSMCLNLGRSNLMLTGGRTLPYKVTPGGSPRLYALDGISYSGVAIQSLKAIQQQARQNVLEQQTSAMFKRSVELQGVVAAALAGVSINTAFPTTLLGDQLRGVARMMSASRSLNHRRQVFFVDIEGFDFHESLLTRQADRLKEVNDALQAFYNYLQESGLWSQTVLFTASDFGRALQSNGKGADHGWGSHHLVMGGPVRGRTVYGQWPATGLRTPEDAGQGRLIPTTSIEQYAATLGNWFGVSNADLNYVLPNIDNFASRNLGFLA